MEGDATADATLDFTEAQRSFELNANSQWQ